MIDTLRVMLMAIGATAAALTAAHALLMLLIVAVTVAAMIGLYEVTHHA
jgi:type IV secretory pathway protease TraF